MSIGICPCDTPEEHPVSECTVPGQSNDEVFAADVRALVVALGLGNHARPYSPHAVIHREVLPALRSLPLLDRLTRAEEAVRDALAVAEWCEQQAESRSHYAKVDPHYRNTMIPYKAAADRIRAALTAALSPESVQS